MPRYQFYDRNRFLAAVVHAPTADLAKDHLKALPPEMAVFRTLSYRRRLHGDEDGIGLNLFTKS